MSEPVDDILHGVVHRALVSHVEPHLETLAPERLHLFHDRRSPFVIDIRDRHVSALLGQLEHDAAPDALAAPRHQRRLP